MRDHSARPAGCTCDGSGWTFERTDAHPDGAMVQCTACAIMHFQRQLAAVSGLLPSELSICLDDVAPNGPDTALMVRMARQFCEEPWGIWSIWGSYGNAKTMILQALVNHFRNQGHLAIYMRFTDLLDYIRAGYKPDAPDDARERYARIVAAKCLAIDEVDKPRLTEFAVEFQATFLDDRWRYGVEQDPAIRRHTLLALNHDPAGLPGHIYDRLRDSRFGCYLDVDGADVWYPGITRNMDSSMRPAMPPRQPGGEPCK
ncbi:MAG: hypothetical protein JXO22_07715 [Phycisphaerae bacterium]|nr:hypothetical protein [Phycisphaerae bacterium]